MATATPRRSILEIGDDLIALDDLLFELEGNITGQEEAIDKFLKELGDERDRKLDNYAALIHEVKMRQVGRTAEIERLQARNKTDSNAVDSLKNRLKLFMQFQKTDKIATPLHTFAVTGNGGVAPLITPDDPKKGLPEKYIKMVPEIDYALLRSDLEKGVVVNGYAIGDRGTHLRIR